MATPASQSKRKPTVAKGRIQQWEDIKPMVFQLYIQEKMILTETMIAIQRECGFKASCRAWKTQLQKWGFVKNIAKSNMHSIVTKGTKRALEGKDTVFYQGVTHITPQKIENFKKRKVGGAPPNVTTPPNIICKTPPGLNYEEDSLKEISQELSPHHSPPSEFSGFSVDEISSFGLFGSKTKTSVTTKSDPTEAPHLLMLHRYLSDDLDQPWSVYQLSHQLGDHDTVLAKHRQMIAQVIELVSPSKELDSLPVDPSSKQNSSLELCFMGDQFPADYYSGMDDKQGDETSEILALENLFTLATILAESQCIHGEFATLTLRQEFELAKAVERNGNLEEAEYHCRRILNIGPQIVVQSFLGMILAKTRRLEESIFLLFSALTSYILGFTSFEGNLLYFPSIKSLWDVLIYESELDWAPLIKCMSQMMATTYKSILEGTVNQIFPRLLIHGFSFAHESLVLGMVDSANYMYKCLLGQSSFNLSTLLWEIEGGVAYQDYELLLRREGKWGPGAEKLLLACESMVNLGTPDGLLHELSKSDYIDHLHIISGADEEDPFVNRIGKLLTCDLRQISSHLQNNSKDIQPSGMEGDFLSNFPETSSMLEHLIVSFFAEPVLSSRVTDLVSARGDEDISSLESVSYKYGVTFSDSGMTGISDSRLIVP